MAPYFSVVIPVRNAAEDLSACLASLARSSETAFEVIVVDDHSDSRASVAVACEAKAQVIELPKRGGPGAARNAGAELAQGEALLFLDADVEVAVDTLEELRRGLDENPKVAAVFGSYDQSPAGQNLLSQYRNLLHHYTHQKSQRHAFTFWSGCGAIRKQAFLAHGGFEERFRHPSIEDIELGQRLSGSGAAIRLRREALVRHRKVWRFVSTMRCDLLDRGIPWTRELLRVGHIPADMNMRYSDRALVGVAFLLTVLFSGVVVVEPLWALVPLFVSLSIVVADRLSSSSEGLGLTRWGPLRIVSVVEGLALFALVAATKGSWPWVLGGLSALGSFLWLRRDFYKILMSVRGFAFVFLSFQAHVIFYWICGLAFAIGGCLHWLKPLPPLPAGSSEAASSDATPAGSESLAAPVSSAQAILSPEASSQSSLAERSTSAGGVRPAIPAVFFRVGSGRYINFLHAVFVGALSNCSMKMLSPGEPLPAVETADEEGLVAVGGSLEPSRIVSAYRAGAFPWPLLGPGMPMLWFSPDPRFVLFPGELHCSRSLKRSTRRKAFRISVNQCFDAVVAGCSRAKREGQEGTWITGQMRTAYRSLYELGIAHSIEVHASGEDATSVSDQTLVGGLYGLAIGRVFFGESMFSMATDAVQDWLCRTGAGPPPGRVRAG